MMTINIDHCAASTVSSIGDRHRGVVVVRRDRDIVLMGSSSGEVGYTLLRAVMMSRDARVWTAVDDNGKCTGGRTFVLR